RVASPIVSTQRSVAIRATFVSPSPSTSTVAVRSLSIAWIGDPNSRRPPLPVPSGGLIVRRAAPAYSVFPILLPPLGQRGDQRGRGLERALLRVGAQVGHLARVELREPVRQRVGLAEPPASPRLILGARQIRRRAVRVPEHERVRERRAGADA